MCVCVCVESVALVRGRDEGLAGRRGNEAVNPPCSKSSVGARARVSRGGLGSAERGCRSRGEGWRGGEQTNGEQRDLSDYQGQSGRRTQAHTRPLPFPNKGLVSLARRNAWGKEGRHASTTTTVASCSVLPGRTARGERWEAQSHKARTPLLPCAL